MVNSEKKSSSSISPSSPQLAIIFLTSPSMVAAWPFICSPRNAELCSISLRRSGLASNTTPLPKIGVMNGYASAWSRSSSAERKKNSLASRAGQEDDVLVDQLEPADVAAFVPDALHQSDRVGAELLEVAVLLFATGDAGNDRSRHDGIPSSPKLQLLPFLWRLASGASG